MKKIIFIIGFIGIICTTIAQDSSLFSIPIKKWDMQVISLRNFYPTYLADPQAIRFEVSSQKILFSDFDYEDPVNQGEGYLGKLVIIPGVRFSLFRFSPKSNPKLGIEADLGATIPTFMRAGNHDLIGVDGIYYFALAGKPFEWLSLRFSKHHICTHVGDEYFNGGVDSPIDFDPLVTQLPVRDDFIFSATIQPLYFLNKPQWNILQLYADIGFFKPGVDFMGTRQNKPHKHAFMNYQGGAEVEYYFNNPYIGGLFIAGNVSAYQLNAYAPNISTVAGYIFPQNLGRKKLRIGLNYYNGRSWSNQFYNRKEKIFAFFVAADI